MSKQAYTSIPPTSDLAYWQVSAINSRGRCVTFVPKDRELHRRLKIQAALLAKLKGKVRVADEVEELGHIPKAEYIPGSPRQRFNLTTGQY